jgi:acyl-CoA reductase-like NAD-dependent aldehyde dehydrogenase
MSTSVDDTGQQFIDGGRRRGGSSEPYTISEMPHGGYQASGFGKDMSTSSVDGYTQVKHVMAALSAEPRKSWHDTVFTG